MRDSRPVVLACSVATAVLLASGCGPDSGGPFLRIDVWSDADGLAQSEALAVHPSGDVFVAGTFFAGGQDGIFLARHDPDGGLVWRRRYSESTARGLRAWELAVDAQGDLLIAVEVQSGHLRGQEERGLGDAALLKVAAESGAVLWRRQWGSSYPDESLAVRADASGNTFVTGTTLGDIIDDEVDDWLPRAFLVAFDSEGELLWRRQPDLRSRVPTSGRAIAVHDEAFVYYLVHDGAAGEDLLTTRMRKLASDGWDYRWNTEWGLAGEDAGEACAVDSAGGIYIAGRAGGDPGSRGAGCIGGEDIFVTKLGDDEREQWTRIWDSRGCDSAYGLAVGADDSVFVVGTTRGDLDSARNLSGQSPFLLKLAPDGAPVWTALLGGEARAEGKALGLAADGQTIYVTGEIEVPREGYSEFSPYLLVMSVDWPASDQPSLYSTVIHHTLVAE